jgi:hypothetical protein
MMTIVESGMTFGPFNPEDVFHIENSETFRKLENVKTVEFVLCKQKANNNELWLVEAKQSSPMPGNNVSFKDYIEEIEQKFDNSLCVLISLWLNRFFDPELSEKIKTVDLKNIQINFIFVIKGHKEEWLPPLKDALQQKLIPLCKTLKLGSNNIIVLNDTMAKIKGLIV